jgi:hypothetical protein
MDLLEHSKGMGISNIALYEATGICGSVKNSLARFTIAALARLLLIKWENVINDERNS